MVKLKINSNDAGQRLDRFLRKYMKRAPLSAIYKIIRKDLKVNGKRAKEETILQEGDELVFYMPEERFGLLTRPVKQRKAKRQFKVAYEDENVLIVEKPWGLLTHGDSSEKKNTLMNQVCGYLQEKGEYDPAKERSFTPSPVNRLDRNTTGLVIFGKNAASLRFLTKLLRDRDAVSKYYVTIVAGDFKEPMEIDEALLKDSKTNTVRVVKGSDADSSEVKTAKSIVRPLERSGRTESGQSFSIVEVELVTGRTHQIRAHLASKGFPLAGDSKYGTAPKGKRANDIVRKLGVTTQLLHACRLEFGAVTEDGFENLSGLVVRADVPEEFDRVWQGIKGGK